MVHVKQWTIKDKMWPLFLYVRLQKKKYKRTFWLFFPSLFPSGTLTGCGIHGAEVGKTDEPDFESEVCAVLLLCETVLWKLYGEP